MGSASRREMLRQGIGAVVGGAALATAGSAAVAQAPAIRTGTQAGRAFRSLVSRPNQRPTLETVTLRDIHPHQLLIRTRAAHSCYSVTNLLLPPGPPRSRQPGVPPYPGALMEGHGGVGIVEAVGSAVVRAKVGDRVVIPVTPNCGQCYYCLRGRGDQCAVERARPRVALGDLSDGMAVYGNLGGFGELMIAWDDQAVPIVAEASSEELSLMCCVMAVGLGIAQQRMPVTPGSEVLVLGAGPLGLSAVQGARIQGAAQIIVVEPVPYRRDLAKKVGATTVLDPNAYSYNELVAEIRRLCTPPIKDPYAGGRGENADFGPAFILEAVGADRLPPKVPSGPDPTGIQSLQLAWDVCPNAGVIRTTGVGQAGNAMISFPAANWSNAGKTHLPGNFGGTNTFRDLPTYARLIDTKQVDARSLVGQTFALDQVMDAVQMAVDRTSISAVVTFAS